MEVMRLAERRLGVLLLIDPVLDLERTEARADAIGRWAGHLGVIGAGVPIAEQHRRHSAPDLHGVEGAAPRGPERARGEERQAQARVDEVAGRDVDLGEIGDASLEMAAQLIRGCRPKCLDRGGLAVDGEHAPTGAQQLPRVATRTAPQVDREWHGSAIHSIGREALDGEPHCRPCRPIDRDLVVARPVLGIGHEGEPSSPAGDRGYPSSMVGVPLRELPPTAQAAWAELRDRLGSELGDELVAMWAHGGTTSIGDPAHAGDLDTYIILSRKPDEPTTRKIEEHHAALAEAHRVDWDVWYVLADDARRSESPSHAWHEGRRDTTWAIHRASWLAGRYVTLHGAEPGEIVTAPAWDELLVELDRELEHIERHVVEGDTDSYEATYAILTGSRILHALATRDVVMSKRAAGTWALERLPVRWHNVLHAALRSYDGQGTRSDEQLLAAEMSPFVSFVREDLPAIDRAGDAHPRWSGY